MSNIDTFEYQYGFITVSINQLNKKLNELGSKGWDISTLTKINESHGFDSEGGILYKWEIFMKRKIQGLNK